MDLQFADLPKDKKVYLASDFHLGVPDHDTSLIRERKIIRWLESIEHDAAGIILVGDVFDFWFEYGQVIPKGFVRFQGKVAELTDQGIPVIFFIGNHDLWMFQYFEKELGVQIERKPKSYQIGSHTAHVGHGDGLGPGDKKFKFFKKVFLNRAAIWAFNWLHPDLGVSIAKRWSGHSRNHADDAPFQGEQEWLVVYSKEIEAKRHHDYYIYGHRHMLAQFNISDKSTYFNLGEWITQCNYLMIDSYQSSLIPFEN